MIDCEEGDRSIPRPLLRCVAHEASLPWSYMTFALATGLRRQIKYDLQVVDIFIFYLAIAWISIAWCFRLYTTSWEVSY